MAINDPNAPPLPGLSAYQNDAALWNRISPFQSAMAALQARMGQPQQAMYTPEESAQRQAANKQQYDLGMLAALSSDEGMKDVGGTLFKNALAARQPKVTERGVADPISGKFSYNPAYTDDKLAAQYQALAQHEATAQTGFLEAQNRAREADQRQQELLGFRRDMAAERQAQTGQAAADRQSTQNYRLEDQMRTDFEHMTKDMRGELNATGTIKQVIGSYAGQPVPPFAQQSLVVLLNKFLDPGSVVREGEFNRVVAAQGLQGKAQLLLPRIMRGDVLTPDAVQQIHGLASVYEAAANAKARKIAADYTNVARSRGLNENSIITDPNWRTGAVSTQAGKPAAGQTAVTVNY